MIILTFSFYCNSCVSSEIIRVIVLSNILTIMGIQDVNRRSPHYPMAVSSATTVRTSIPCARILARRVIRSLVLQ